MGPHHELGGLYPEPRPYPGSVFLKILARLMVENSAGSFIWGFLQMVPIMRIMRFSGLSWGPPSLENYHVIFKLVPTCG